MKTKKEPEAGIVDFPILNRISDVASDGWYHLVPMGDHPIVSEGERFIQVVDNEAVAKMVAAFNRKKAADPSYLMLVDFEHFSHDDGKKTEAAGWAKDMEARPNGVWAQLDLSDLGAAAIKNKRYRSISPVWFPSQTEPLGGNRFRPVEINDAGLTNKNNLQGLVPFWNRSDIGPNNENRNTETRMKKLMAVLGLAHDASEESAVGAVQAIKNRVSELEPFETKHSTLETEHKALKNRYKGLLETSVEAMLDEHKEVITEAGREAWKNRALEDFEGTRTLLDGLNREGGDQKKEPRKPLTNRAPAKTPDTPAGGGDGNPSAEESKQAAAIRNRASEISNKEGVTWATAWRRAESELGG